MIRERAAQQRTCYTRNTPHTPNQPKRQGPRLQGKRIRQNDNRARKKARGAHARHGPSNNKRRRRRRRGANQTAQLKDKHGDQKNRLDIEAIVEFAVQRLQRGGR